VYKRQIYARVLYKYSRGVLCVARRFSSSLRPLCARQALGKSGSGVEGVLKSEQERERTFLIEIQG